MAGCLRTALRPALARLLCGVVLGICGCAAWAAAPDAIHILRASDAPYYREAEAALRAALAPVAPHVHLTTHELVELPDLPGLPGLPELPGLPGLPALAPSENVWIVAIGTQAASLANREYPDRDLVAVLVTRSAWEEEVAHRGGRGRRAAVLIDQPVGRALVLARLLRPSSRRAGTALGPASRALSAEFQDAAVAAGFTIDVVELATGDNPLAALMPLMGRIDIFVAVPDEALFNRTLAKWVLNLCFREHIPVIGFSSAYIEAGALAAVFSTPADIGRQSGELLATLIREEEMRDAQTTGAADAQWRTHDPEYYALRTNPQVAHALEIPLPPMETLYRTYAAALKAAL